MAPQLSPMAQIGLVRRQSPSSSAVTLPSASSGGAAPMATSLPSSLDCGMACIRLGDTSDCDEDQTQACLCKSGRYIASVNTCLNARCTAADAQAGAEYSYGACLFLGVNVSTIALPESTKGVDLTTAPQVYNRAFFNVQAVMSSICAALLLLALVLGFFSCRARARLESQSQTQQGSWTNMGTHASRSHAQNGGKSFGGTSRGFDPTSTFASASYPQPVKRAAGMGMERSRGFTNRLTLDEEEWEMGDTSAGPATGRSRTSGRGMGRIPEGGPVSGSGSADSFVSS